MASPIGRRIYHRPRVLHPSDEGLGRKVHLQACQRTAKHRPVPAVVVDHMRQQALAGLFEVALDQFGHILPQRPKGRAGGFHARLAFVGLRIRAYVEADECFKNPGVKPGFVLEGNSEDLADRPHRHRVGVLISRRRARSCSGGSETMML